MIVIESKHKHCETILKQYPSAIIADVTSHATDDLLKFSPFYPHGNIPVPFSGATATCVEAVWQGLKVFESADVDADVFRNDTMKNIKRTVRGGQTAWTPSGTGRGISETVGQQSVAKGSRDCRLRFRERRG